MCPSLIEIGSKTAEKNSAQTDRQTERQTNRHYEKLAVNQLNTINVIAVTENEMHVQTINDDKMFMYVQISTNFLTCMWNKLD